MLGKLKGEAKRVQSTGMLVLSDKFMTSKATRGLIEEDLRTREHVPVRRKRQTTDAFEEGFLVIGLTAITFLAQDKRILASHPIAFLETYTADLHNDKMLTYSIKQVHFLKKDDIMSFSFEAHTRDVLLKLLRTLDRFVLASFRDDKTVAPGTYDLVAPKDQSEKMLEAANTLTGERFVVETSCINAGKMDILGREKRVKSVAVFHPRGVALLSGENATGTMEVFSYRSMKTFGATDASCFGFRVANRSGAGESSVPPKSPRGGASAVGESPDDVFICVYSEESAHLMNTLVTRHARRWEELKEKGEQPPVFPRRYFTNDEA